MTIDFRLVAIGLCVVLSSLFSGSETALTSLHHARIDQILDRRPSGKAFLLAWRDNPALVLSFLLIGNNIVNILASSLATAVSIDYLQDLGFGTGTSVPIALSVGVMTFVLLVFGEILPKTYARLNPGVVVRLLPVLLSLYYLLWPVARVFGGMTRGLFSLTGVDVKHANPTVTEEELEYMIRQGRKEGSLEETQEKMLSGVLELGDRMAKDVMVPRIDMVILDASATLEQVTATVQEHQYSRYPVAEEERDNIVGVFFVKDLLPFVGHDSRSRNFSLRELKRECVIVPKTKKLDDLLREFLARHIHMAIVMDEYGGVSGLVTLEDVIEEMLGEIYDEYDEKEDLARQSGNATWILDGRFRVEDIHDELGIDVLFPEGRQYDTISGLLQELAGRLPSKGEVFLYRSADPDRPTLSFTVVTRERVKIKLVEMTVLPSGEDEKQPLALESARS